MEIPEELRGKAVINLWPTAAKILGVGRNQIYNLANRGEIPILRLGSLRKVPVAKFLEMLGYSDSDGAASTPVEQQRPVTADTTLDDAGIPSQYQGAIKVALGRNGAYEWPRVYHSQPTIGFVAKHLTERDLAALDGCNRCGPRVIANIRHAFAEAGFELRP